MKLFTVGLTQKTAELFFTTLKKAGVKHLIDVRLNNVSQLAGFTKRDDLAYFAKSICRIPYTHATDLAPTEEILNAVKKAKGSWGTYEKKFMDLIGGAQGRRAEPRDLRGRVPPMQRADAAPLPPAPGRRIPRQALEGHSRHTSVVARQN